MNISIQLDFRSGKPIYIQIIEQIQHKVQVGELKNGDQLPTVRQMATDLRINFNTVARAYRILDETGLISTQHGRGTYIWGTPPPEAGNKDILAILNRLTRRFLQEALGLGCNEAEIYRSVDENLADLRQKAPEEDQ